MLRTPPTKIDSSLFAVAPTRGESAGAGKVVSGVGEIISEPHSFWKTKPIDALMDVGVSSDPALVGWFLSSLQFQLVFCNLVNLNFHFLIKSYFQKVEQAQMQLKKLIAFLALSALESRQDGKASEATFSNPDASVSGNDEVLNQQTALCLLFILLVLGTLVLGIASTYM